MGHKGRANGGPLNGATLEAGLSWDGRVEKDFTGMYRWNHLRETWDWEIRDRPATRRTGRPNRSKAHVPPPSEV